MTRGVYAERKCHWPPDKLRHEENAVIIQGEQAVAVTYGSDPDCFEGTECVFIESVRRCEKYIDLYLLTIENGLGVFQLVELSIQIVSSEFAPGPQSQEIFTKGVIDVLVAVHGNLPAEGLHFSDLIPEVGSVLRYPGQFGISIVGDNSQKRLDSESLQESLYPEIALPVHVWSDIVKADQISPLQ